MKITRYRDPDYQKQLRRITASTSLFDPGIEDRTRSIITEVQHSGDRAVLNFTRKFDGASLTSGRLAVTKAELLSASIKVSRDLRHALKAADRNVARFSQKSRRRDWSERNPEGARVGEKFDPFQRVGIYVPGGTAPLVSTAIMTVTLARVAGCPEIVVCTPCNREGTINPALLYAVKMAGATEIYRVGGAQAIAAMALGTSVIGKVQKIFGPGNAYVVAAKRLLFGHVAIDLLPGPSELLVIADDTASPRFIAADMLAQAEHGSGHERVWLVTTSGKLLRTVQQEIPRQLESCERRDYIAQALKKNGWLIEVKNLAEAARLANLIAPEHCEIQTRNARALSRDVLNAGAIFLGDNSPTALGDYIAGPSHTLPTGGAGACFAGLTVDQFQRRTSVVEYSRTALKKSVSFVEQISGIEGLDAHGKSARIRLE